jgi:hypothetical protein
MEDEVVKKEERVPPRGVLSFMAGNPLIGTEITCRSNNLREARVLTSRGVKGRTTGEKAGPQEKKGRTTGAQTGPEGKRQVLVKGKSKAGGRHRHFRATQTVQLAWGEEGLVSHSRVKGDSLLGET